MKIKTTTIANAQGAEVSKKSSKIESIEVKVTQAKSCGMFVKNCVKVSMPGETISWSFCIIDKKKLSHNEVIEILNDNGISTTVSKEQFRDRGYWSEIVSYNRKKTLEFQKEKKELTYTFKKKLAGYCRDNGDDYKIYRLDVKLYFGLLGPRKFWYLCAFPKDELKDCKTDEILDSDVRLLILGNGEPEYDCLPTDMTEEKFKDSRTFQKLYDYVKGQNRYWGYWVE